MKYDFELTSDKYRDIQQALEYAQENAVHEDSEVAFRLARKELHRQYTGQLDD